MLKQLRKQLTLISTCITGLILCVICLLALQTSEKQLNARSQLAFQNHLNTIAYQLQHNQTIKNSWLAQIEADNDLIISIEDNGSPFLFRGAWNPHTDRHTLIEDAKKTALEVHHFDADTMPLSTFTISKVFFGMETNTNDSYHVAVASVPSSHGTYTLTLLQDRQEELLIILHTRILFFSISTLGIALLGLFSYWFSGRAIKPVEINQQKQVEFIAAASHELKSPLAVIQSSSSALIGQDPLQQTRFIHTIQKECTRMARLVDDLLLLATADADTWSIHTQPAELDILLIDLLDTFLPLSHVKQQKLTLNLPSHLVPPVPCDGERLVQAITILLDNALYYVPEKGHITLTMQTTPSTVKLKVIDNGPGISPACKAYVFDRFYRIDTSRQDKAHYGLGLSIAREIIRLHQGTLTLEDTPGGGCTFIIELPL